MTEHAQIKLSDSTVVQLYGPGSTTDLVAVEIPHATSGKERLWVRRDWRSAEYAVVPIVVAGNTPFDPATQVMSGPVTTVNGTQVTRTFTIRSKTAPEFDADKKAVVDSLPRLTLIALFKHENDIRALQSQAPLTRAAFEAWLRTQVA